MNPYGYWVLCWLLLDPKCYTSVTFLKRISVKHVESTKNSESREILHFLQNFFTAKNHGKNTAKPAHQLDFRAILKSYQNMKKLPYGNFLRQHHNAFLPDRSGC